MIVKYKDEQWRFRIKDVLLHTYSASSIVGARALLDKLESN